MKPARSLRWHLVQVLLAGILPIGIFAAALLYLHWQAQEQQRRQLQAETTRLVAVALDNALEGSVQRLGILARQWANSAGSEAELYEAAKSALAGNADWENMLAFSASGEGVFRLDRPFGTPIPSMRLRDYSRRALQENVPTISDIFVNATNQKAVVGVAYPVARKGVVTHVLMASLNLRWFDQLLAQQGLPAGGIAGIFDHRLQFVARSHDGDARRGSSPAPDLHKRMLVEKQGLGRFASLDNTSVYTSWTYTRHGWAVALAMPAGPIDGALWRSMMLLGALLLAVVVAGLAFAALKARRITGSLSLLEARARQLSRGEPLAPAPGSHVGEVDRALDGVESAAALLAAAREERDRLLEGEQQRRAAAEQANHSKDEFLAMLGHELRNPLAAVSNAAAIVRSSDRTPEQLEFAAGVIHRQSGHLKRLIDDLLDVGRVMTGKIMLDARPLDLQASLHHVITTLKTAGTLDQRRVHVQAAPVWVSGDQTRIEQILSNLLVNAATYTRTGGEIHVTLAEEDGEALVRIADDGVGIPPEEQARIFELFYQGEPSGKRVHSGLGIGLTLVKRLAELHGGAVTVKSAGRDRGTTFTVRMPACASVVHREAEFLKAGARRTVLLVEDNADERESLRMALELHGHRVVHAADAESALAKVRTEKPSIAFIDIGLPGMDGYGLARELRSAYDGQMALVALTGYGTPDDERRAKDAGFVRHLTKPVAVTELAAIVSRAVS